MSLTQKKCINCNEYFTFKSRKAKYCTPNCKSKFYYKKDIEKHKYRRKQYREKNKEKIAKDKKQWKKANAEYVRDWHKNYDNSRYKSNLKVRIKCTLRSRLNCAIKKNHKAGSAVSDLGCSIEDLKFYLEAQFYPNSETGEMMSWDNWSRDGWHIDHIKPLSSYDLTDPEELKEACHYTNLQPLWAKENLSKGIKYE